MLLTPFDFDANGCGWETNPETGYPKATQSVDKSIKDYKYIYYANPLSTMKTVCVKKCPGASEVA